MFKAKLAAAIFSVSFVMLITVGAIRDLKAQIANPGVQQSGAVTAGHAVAWGPGAGQIQDSGGAVSTVLSVFGRAGAVVATLGDYSFSLISGSLACSQQPAFTGDVTTSAGTCANTLATVNSNVGAFGGSNSIPSFTVDGKGRITAAAANVPAIPFSEVTGTVPILQGGTGQTTAAGAISALMPTPTRAGDVAYWNGSNWVTLAGNNSGTQVFSENSSGVPAWTTGSGVTAVTIAAGTGVSVTGTCAITTTGTCTVASNLSSVSNSLSADVLLNNTSTYFDGPSTAQGTSGTWFASGSVLLFGTVGDGIMCKLWDGTTVIASGEATIPATSLTFQVALSGSLATPAANIRISCKDASNNTGKIFFNNTGNSKDSTLTVVRQG